MDIAALIAWILTAAGGLYLIGTWLARGGVRQQRSGNTRFPPLVVFGHPILAAAGLVVWIAYLLGDDSAALAWAAFALLVPVAALGIAMFLPWLADRRSAGAVPTPDAPAEQHLAVPIVVGHGVFAVTTVVLVLLAAARAGG